jgi:hypothetical protein
VRSVHGRTSSWFRGAQDQHQAHIRAGGVEKDVLLEGMDDRNDEIDAAYRTKYGRYAESIVDTTVTLEARAATLKLVPRPCGGRSLNSGPEAGGMSDRDDREQRVTPLELFLDLVVVFAITQVTGFRYRDPT